MPEATSLIANIRSFIRRKTSQKYRFNLQYESNKWEGLRDIADLGRYSIIVGYANHFFKNARLLDLGCGEGVLLEKFATIDYAYYLGIDFSEVAIQKAKKMENDKTHFQVGDCNHLHIDGLFDVIICNEILYYLLKPKESMQLLFPNLRPGGVFIFSMVDKHGEERQSLWTKLDEILEPLDKTKITNKAGDSWTVKVYKIRV